MLLESAGMDKTGSHPESRVVIYGAGEAGELVVQGLMRLRTARVRPVAFVDDDPQKAGKTLSGLPIESAGGPIRPILARYGADRVLIAMPSAPGRRIREIHKKLLSEEIPAWIVPGLSSIVSSNDPITTFRSVEPEDFLRRHPRVLEKGRVGPFLKNQRVLVTGAGGTIGQELVSQLATFDLESLGCADQSELAIYQLHEKFSGHTGTGGKAELFLSDMSRPSDVESVFDEFSPTVVFHAAAYKHVALLEAAPRPAILNNVRSTLHLTQSSRRHDVHTFVHISTDKAIRPTSLMGATKRIGELIVQSAQSESERQGSDSRFMSVRFGNVLGSSGSVFPKFVEQIKKGGPVTVTDPRARRYFMLTSEAVELVLLTAAVGHGGRIYLLDLGEPLTITELVNDLIRFFGKKPGEDIPIVYTGLGPGEKLVEDLSDVPTRPVDEHLLEVIEPPVDAAWVDPRISALIESAESNDTDEVFKILERLVPDYRPDRVSGGIASFA